MGDTDTADTMASKATTAKDNSEHSIDESPRTVAAEAVSIIRGSRPTPADIARLRKQLLERHAHLKLRPVVSSEEVVEAFCRCRLTNQLVRRFQLDTRDLPRCINVSHKAVRRVCHAEPPHQHIAISELRLHAENHASALFVVYSASEVTPELQRLQGKLMENASLV